MTTATEASESAIHAAIELILEKVQPFELIGLCADVYGDVTKS